MPPNVVLPGPALHAAAMRIAQTAGPKQQGFGGQTMAGAMQRSVNSAPPPARYGGGGPQNAGLPATAISAAKGAGQLRGGANTTAKAPRTSAPKAPVATKPVTPGLSSSAFNPLQPLSGRDLQTVVNTQTQANANAALQPLQQNGRQLTGQEQTISNRLAGYDRLYSGMLQQNAANAPAQSAGAVGSAQAAGQVGSQGISDTQTAIQQAIQSSPELAGAAMDGGARQMIANEMAAQRLAQAATTGANVGYAGAVGGNAGQEANTLAGSGIMGAREGQANVAGIFGRALAANTANEGKVTANLPADRMKLFTTLRQQAFTNAAVNAGLGIKNVTLGQNQQKINLSGQTLAEKTLNDQANQRLKALSISTNASVAGIKAQLAQGNLSERTRHDLATELTAQQRVAKASTGSGSSASKILNIINGYANVYKTYTAAGRTPQQAAAAVILGTKTDGVAGQAAVEMAQNGFLSASTVAALKAQGVPVPASMTKARPAALPTPSIPVFGSGKQPF